MDDDFEQPEDLAPMLWELALDSLNLALITAGCRVVGARTYAPPVKGWRGMRPSLDDDDLQRLRHELTMQGLSREHDKIICWELMEGLA